MAVDCEENWLVKGSCGDFWGLVVGISGNKVFSDVVEVKGSKKKRERDERDLRFDGKNFLALIIISLCLQLRTNLHCT